MTLSPSTLRAAHCWFNVDRIANDPATTTWKRTARLRQVQWREAQGFPIGAEPYAGGDGTTLVGKSHRPRLCQGERRELLVAQHPRCRSLSARNPEAGQMLKAFTSRRHWRGGMITAQAAYSRRPFNKWATPSSPPRYGRSAAREPLELRSRGPTGVICCTIRCGATGCDRKP